MAHSTRSDIVNPALIFIGNLISIHSLILSQNGRNIIVALASEFYQEWCNALQGIVGTIRWIFIGLDTNQVVWIQLGS